ncbi:MAG TPA: hypothetical protein VEA38_21205 [Terriglobales bacterium]|nr:hypothetical protein [Terriglobales bacterium]
MRYAAAFFELQLHFARRAAALSGASWPRALLDYTNLYIRFGCGFAFDPAQPVWRAYVAGVTGMPADAAWTYDFYLAHGAAMAGPPVAATFGCFAYARLPDDRLRLHFVNAEPDGGSPLAKERQAARRADLAALFAHVKAAHGDASLRVVGGSWLYNLEAYCRLFPPSYLATARVSPRRFRRMSLWGQFLDRRGAVKPAMADPFRERLARATDIDALDACFPLPALTVEGPVRAFYAFYGV